jgi:hypothetical protein
LIQVYRYGGVALAVVALVTAGLWPWLSPPARLGILVAALVAYPVQVLAFYLLVRFRGHRSRFLVVWMGGTLVRMGLVLVAALVITRVEQLPPAPTLLALAGFFFGLLLLEPLFLRRLEADSSENL